MKYITARYLHSSLNYFSLIILTDFCMCCCVKAVFFICMCNSDSLPLFLSFSHTGMHTSSIKALYSLLWFLIRKLSLGFRALAYRHLYQAFSEMCSKHGAAICIEFTGSEGERKEGGGRKRDGRRLWCWRRPATTNTCLETRLFTNRWI